ncbi:IS3 family transposase [Schnuerera ultunensis]
MLHDTFKSMRLLDAYDEYIYFYNYEKLQKRLNSLSSMVYRALAA